MDFKRIVCQAALGLCVSSRMGSVAAAPVETPATRALIVEMERLNPRVPQLQQAIAHGADVNAYCHDAPYNGFPLLHIAVQASWQTLTLLVDKGANLDAQDKNGDTALALATEDGAVEAVQFLLSKGANPNLRNVNGRTALGKARYTLTRPALSRLDKRQVQFIIDILKSRGAQE